MADPLDWLRSNMPSFTPEAKELAKARLEDCKACPQLVRATGQCRECGCMMPVKVFFRNAQCPLGKWGKVE